MSAPFAELLARIRAGDEAALLALHTQYANLVYSVAYRVLGEAMAAEEVTQDTFLRLWHKAETYDPAKGSFLTWLVTITRRLAIDRHRQQQRDPLREMLALDGASERWEVLVGAEDSSDLRRTLIAVLYTLPDNQREALELAYFYGLSHSEIADYLGQPVGTIKTRLRLGMQKLREAWLADLPGNPNPDA